MCCDASQGGIAVVARFGNNERGGATVGRIAIRGRGAKQMKGQGPGGGSLPFVTGAACRGVRHLPGSGSL